jgi:hypothetical protein
MSKLARVKKAGVVGNGGFEATGVLTRYDLYRACVQDGERMVRFLRAVHGGKGKGQPRVLRDDFAGPAGLACAWASDSVEHVGIGVDVDAEPLGHAPVRGEIAQRVKLVVSDAEKCSARADVICAMNFAMCELHTRAEAIGYLRGVLGSLESGGVFACDIYGGVNAWVPGALVTFAEGPVGPGSKRVGKIEYHWQQKEADCVRGMVENHLHFKLGAAAAKKLGCEAKWTSAFVYQWRLWSIAELRDLMMEAGFGSVEVYAQMGDALDGAGGLHVKPVERGEELEEDYVVYIVGRKGAGKKQDKTTTPQKTTPPARGGRRSVDRER